MEGGSASRNEYWQLFLVCVLPIHIWAILVFLRRMPTMLTQLKATEIIGVAAYVLAFALLESLFLFGVLSLADHFLFRKLLNSTPLPVGTIFVFLASATAAVIHLHKDWDIQIVTFSQWSKIWGALGLVSIGLLLGWLKRNPGLKRIIFEGVDRLSLLSMLYLGFDLAGVIVIVLRNL
jgi:hypothetical protein